MTTKFNRKNITQEMIDSSELRGIYPWSSEPGTYIEYLDGAGQAWYTEEHSELSPVLTCDKCSSEFVNNSSVADSSDVCPHCNHTDRTYLGNNEIVTIEIREEKMVTASCGHAIPATQLLDTSSGSSCPDCYDRKSN